MKIIIINTSILTHNTYESFIPEGYIKIQDQNIIEIGSMGDGQFEKEGWEIMDGSGYLVAPGLINAHTHVAMTILRGFADDLPLWEWLTEKIWPLEDQLNSEDVYWASLLGMIEMIKTGTTTFNDMYMFMDETAQAVESIGMRAYLSRGLQGFDGQSAQRLRENLDLFYKWQGEAEGRIKVGTGPHAVYTCEPRFWSKVLELVEKTGMMIHTHLSETPSEVENCIKEYGKTPVRLLKDLGVFHYPVVAAHGVHLTENDIGILKENDISIVYNPGSNLKLGSGHAPVPDLLKHGINVALGTDSAASNNNLDMLEEIRLASLIHKGLLKDSTSITASQSIDMATMAGAKALHWEDQIGTLAIGKKADLMMINIQETTFFPKYNILSNLVYSCHSTQVKHVMINGRWIMRDRKILTVDEGNVLKQVERLKKKFL